MAQVVCPSFLRGRRLRATKLDSLGRVVYSPGSFVVSKGFISVNMSPETDDGEEINEKNAGGETCVAEAGEESIKWYNVEINFCNVDPDLVTLINPTWTKILNQAGDTIGWEESLNTDPSSGFGLELWTDVSNIAGLALPSFAQGAWGYLVLPRLRGGVTGDLNVENALVTFTYNAKTKDANQWGIGPHVMQQDDAGAPSKLFNPLKTSTPRAFQTTTLAPPADQCGAQPLSNPAGPTLLVVKDDEVVSGLGATATATTIGGRVMQINWGDGTTPATIATATPVDHTYADADPGTYVVSVKFTDAAQETTYKQIVVPFP